jgi:transposase
VQKIATGNSSAFIGFLIWLCAFFSRYVTIHLYVDNAGWHKSKRVTTYLVTQHKIIMHFFPPYSPELNPMEWDWHELRRITTHTRRFQNKEECWQVIQEHFETRKVKNKHFLCQYN